MDWQQKFRNKQFQRVADQLNIWDDPWMLDKAREFIENTHLGSDFLTRVYTYMEGIGCEAAEEYNRRKLDKQVETYIKPLGGESNFRDMEVEKKKSLFWGFWHRGSKEGD